MSSLGKAVVMVGLHPLIIDALAVHRITHLVTEDTIPFGPVRDEILRRWPNSLAAEFVTCPWCMGMYVGAGVIAARTLLPKWWTPAATTLAFSSITGILATWENNQ